MQDSKSKSFHLVFKVNAKATELKVAHERYECALEETRRQMKEKEKEKQSHIIKLQMEVKVSFTNLIVMQINLNGFEGNIIFQNENVVNLFIINQNAATFFPNVTL